VSRPPLSLSSSSSYHTPPESIFSPNIEQIVFPRQYYGRCHHQFEPTQMHAPQPEYPISYPSHRPFNDYSSPFTNEVPPLLVNKVFPLYMRRGICFQCQRTGHFKSFCPYYHCENCKRPSPQHYPKNCPFHHVNSPPYHSEDDDDEEEEDDIPDQLRDEFNDDLGGNGAWGNILGEPIDD
jgi:hypothetical protein